VFLRNRRWRCTFVSVSLVVSILVSNEVKNWRDIKKLFQFYSVDQRWKLGRRKRANNFLSIKFIQLCCFFMLSDKRWIISTRAKFSLFSYNSFCIVKKFFWNAVTNKNFHSSKRTFLLQCHESLILNFFFWTCFVPKNVFKNFLLTAVGKYCRFHNVPRTHSISTKDINLSKKFSWKWKL